MPEFILDTGSSEAARDFRHLDAFTQGYVEALFFTDASTSDDGELEHATFADLAPSTLEQIKTDCARFQAEHGALLDAAYDEFDYEPDQAGRDFWFTRNGHGAGFWDRGLGVLGDQLSALCGYGTDYRPRDVVMGDDGCVYVE